MRYAACLFALLALPATPALAQAMGNAWVASPVSVPSGGGTGWGVARCTRCSPDAGNPTHAIQAEPHDVRVGYRVLSIDGSTIGSVVAVQKSSAVVATPTTLVRVPDDAFGKARTGLVLRVSRARLEAMARAAAAAG